MRLAGNLNRAAYTSAINRGLAAAPDDYRDRRSPVRRFASQTGAVRDGDLTAVPPSLAIRRRYKHPPALLSHVAAL